MRGEEMCRHLQEKQTFPVIVYASVRLGVVQYDGTCGLTPLETAGNLSQLYKRRMTAGVG